MVSKRRRLKVLRIVLVVSAAVFVCSACVVGYMLYMGQSTSNFVPSIEAMFETQSQVVTFHGGLTLSVPPHWLVGKKESEIFQCRSATLYRFERLKPQKVAFCEVGSIKRVWLLGSPRQSVFEKWEWYPTSVGGVDAICTAIEHEGRVLAFVAIEDRDVLVGFSGPAEYWWKAWEPIILENAHWADNAETQGTADTTSGAPSMHGDESQPMADETVGTNANSDPS